MWNSHNKETLQLLQSPPVPVYFAGFESDTYRLQRAGWQLSVEKQMDYGAEYSYRLALKHEPAKLYAISNQLRVPMQLLYGVYGGDNPMSLINFFKETGFQIICVAPHIQFQVHAVNHQPSFSAFDAEPQWEKMSKNVSLEDIAVFRPLNADSEIVVHPDSVPELLEKIRAVQAPLQKEIREKRRLEAFRKSNEGQIITDGFGGYNPAKEIKAQLIVVGE